MSNKMIPSEEDESHVNLLPDDSSSIPSREATDDSVGSLRNRSGTAIANKNNAGGNESIVDANQSHAPAAETSFISVVSEATSIAKEVVSPGAGGIYASALLMIKAVLGIGWIAIATSARMLGGGVVSAIIICIAVGGYFSTAFIAECCIKSKSWSYEEMVRSCVPGNKTRKCFGFLTSGMLIFNQMGVLVAYAIMIAELLNILISDRQGNTILLKGFWNTNGVELGTFIMPFLIFIFVTPFSLLKDLNLIRHFVILAVFSMVFMVITLAYIIIRYGVEKSSIKNAGTPWGVDSGSLDFWISLNAITAVIFGLKFQQHLPKIVSEMSDRTIHTAKVTGAYANTVGAIITLTLALLGLYAFGWGPGPEFVQNLREFTSGDGATNRAYQRDVIVWIATILVVLSTACGYLIQAFTLRNSCNSIVKRIRGVPRNLPDSDDRQVPIPIFGTYKIGLGRLLDLIIAVVLQIICIIIALVANSFMSVVHYMGAIMGSYIMFWGPGLFVLFARAKYDAEFNLLSPGNWLPIAFVPVGLFIMVLGTIAAAKVS